MSDAWNDAPIPQDIPRDRWGRPLIIPPEGGKPIAYTRCTTYVGALEDTYNLGRWQQRMTVAGIASRPDLHLRAASLGLPPDDDGTPAREAEAKRWKTAMDQVVDDAREAAAASAAATIGTSLHTLTEAIDRGQDIGTIPERYRPHLDNYRQATQTLTAVEIERFLVHDGLQIGGTADRIVRVDGHDGLIIADVKTGSIEFGAGKIAMQLAVYAHSDHYDPATGGRQPIDGIRHDLGIIIHLNAKTGTCALYWADLAAGWEAVQLATQVRAWRARKGLLTPADLTATRPAVDAVEQMTAARVDASIRAAIDAAASADDLVTLWRSAAARGAWTDLHTAAAKARLNSLTAPA